MQCDVIHPVSAHPTQLDLFKHNFPCLFNISLRYATKNASSCHPPPSPSLSPRSPHTYATPGAAGSWGVAPSMAGGVGARCGGVGAARSTAARRPRLPRVGIQSCVLPPPLKKKYHRERRRAQNKGRPTQTAFFCYKKIKNNLADGRTRTYAGYPI